MGLDFRGKHLEFLEDQTSELDLEGARFSGKTWACCAKIILSCLKYPGIEWLACRYSNENTRQKIKPEFQRIARMYGVELDWTDDEACFKFPAVGDRQSRVYCYGLKSQSRLEELAKVRGLGVACIWNDQTEELPQQLSEELRFGTRQPGYPHQLIFSPNPPPEDHYLCDQFPEECSPDNTTNPFPHRRYIRVSLYDNAHNLPDGKIKELEDLYPITHAKHKALILGMRGPNVTGTPIYDGVFSRELHVHPVAFDPNASVLEAIHVGQHHPVWTVSQRSPFGMKVLGGIMGKRMFLEDFMPVVDYYRAEWFEGHDRFKVCCDSPPSADDEGNALRFTHVNILRDAGMNPAWRPNSNAPDVRESVIQHTASLMRRTAGRASALLINADPTKWLMISQIVTKQTKLFVDGCEGSYVWDENFVSVGSKKVRQPKSDQWVDGWQRCLENTVLNFAPGHWKDEKPRSSNPPPAMIPSSPHSWMY